MVIKQVPAHSNNFGIGRSGKQIKFLVCHWIVGTLESADATFQNPDRIASAHYGIGDTEIHQYVKETDTAYHAGNLTVNRESIGIEHEGGWDLGNGQRAKPTEETLKTSAVLVADLCKRYNIPIDKDHIFPHNKFSATQCPGLLDIDQIIKLAKGVEDTMTIDKKVFESLITELDQKTKKLQDQDNVIKALDGTVSQRNQELEKARLDLETTENALAGATKEVIELTEKVKELSKPSTPPPVTQKPNYEEIIFFGLSTGLFRKI